MPKRTLRVYGDDLANLRESGLEDATIRANGLRTVRDSDELAKILNRSKRDSCCQGGLVFPYRGIDGDVNGFARVRPHEPRIRKGKPIKYEQPVGEALRAYFPSASIEGLQGTQPVFITEGEKKALALSQLGVAAIGLGGVDCWGKNGELIEDLSNIAWSDRDAYVIFDYDEKPVTRKNVQSAAKRLSGALYDARTNEVFIVEIPPGPHGEKQGIDDFLVANGADAFWELVKESRPVKRPSNEGRVSSINLIRSTGPKLDQAAYAGFAGEFINAVETYTEATDAGILAHLLPAVGTLIGPRLHVWGGAEQPARLNTALVGPTSTGRKGTSFVPVKMLMCQLDSNFWDEQCVGGLSSGEGLIQKVSDERTKNDDGEWEVVPAEKRLYVVEPEFSRVLTQTRREGNILSQVMREAYDSGNLGVLTRNPLSANGAHISITGHITPEELTKRLTEIEMANGFGNRFLWFHVESKKELPDGKPIPVSLFIRLKTRLKKHLRLASKLTRLKRDEEATVLWRSVYSGLRRAKPGLQGAMLARGESIVLRLSLIYAILTGSDVISTEHLEAAMAVWRYNEESVRLIFPQKTGNSLADKLYRLLDGGPMLTTQFHQHTGKPAIEIRQALQQLADSGIIKRSKITKKGPGRPPEQWEQVNPVS